MLVNLLRINSILVGIVGSTMSLPLIVSIVYREGNQLLFSYLGPIVVSIIVLLAVNLPLRKRKIDLSIRSSYMIVASAWIFASLVGAMPLFFSGVTQTFTDAMFESVSGFSTTGSTIFSDLESLPKSINLWRCITHWLGGMGIVALTVALLPLLGIGGFQLIKAETTGPEKGKVTDKITTTAKILWFIYLVLTLLEAILLKIAGMSFLDAISHAFSTLGTGGFSSNNSSIAGYDSAAIDIIITVFMFLAGINFSMYFYAVTGNFSYIRKNSELKAYIGIIFVCIIGTTLPLISTYGNFWTALRYGAFQTLAIGSTTGFATADFTLWPSTSQFFLLLLFFVGGCSGSTSGGFKVVRWVVLFKQVNNETKKMLHPHGVFSLRLDGQARETDLVTVVTSFMIVFFALIGITTLAGCLAKLDLFTAFTGAISMVGNIGPGFGKLGPACNFGYLPIALKWWYCFAMLAGRLELYTMIILLLPSYWKNR
ncbi:MAG: TrkH family potassium uptake protein [Treponema sp.]|nr:TrkH family potassium uptake protein [Treponema sp.]